MNRTHTVTGPGDTSQPDSLSRHWARLLLSGPARLAPPIARWAVALLAVAGAALLVWSGVIHLQLWSGGYRGISVVGPLFLIQGIASIVLALAVAVFRRLVLLAAAACSPGMSRSRSSRGPGTTTPSTGSDTLPLPATPCTPTSRSAGSPPAPMRASSLIPPASPIHPGEDDFPHRCVHTRELRQIRALPCWTAGA